MFSLFNLILELVIQRREKRFYPKLYKGYWQIKREMTFYKIKVFRISQMFWVFKIINSLGQPIII